MGEEYKTTYQVKQTNVQCQYSTIVYLIHLLIYYIRYISFILDHRN